VSEQPVASPETTATETENSEPVTKLGPGLNLWISDAETDQGTDFCLDVTMSSIKGLLSMQYSIRWDPKILEFKSVKGFTLPFMDNNDFGTHKISEGILTAVWIEDNLQGVNKEEGDLMYQLCFTAIGNSGDETPVRFWSSPTPFEVVVLPENIIPLTSHKGIVKIR
ncbi:MAG: hypothetical protein DWQ02_10165, partial [Bacteroidetes bacterium]